MRPVLDRAELKAPVREREIDAAVPGGFAHQPLKCAPTSVISPLSRAVTQLMDGSMSRCSVELRRGGSLDRDQHPNTVGWTDRLLKGRVF